MKLNFSFKNTPWHTASAIAAALIISFLLLMLSNYLATPKELPDEELVSSAPAESAPTESEVAE